MVGKQELYSRRNCLLIHGLEGKKNKSTDDLVLETINNELETNLQQKTFIDRMHRIVKYRKDNGGNKKRLEWKQNINNRKPNEGKNKEIAGSKGFEWF